MSGSSLWKVAIRKLYGTEDWVNVYTVAASSLAAAVAVGQNIVPKEKAVHRAEVQFVDLTVEPIILGAGGGTVVSLTGTGTVAGGGDYLPLFNVVRVFFRPAAGKPSQKYLRLPVDESENQGGVLNTSTRTAIQTNYASPMMTIPEFVDVDGQPFVSSGVYPRIQERQLKRKRRTRAGFHRGWVQN